MAQELNTVEALLGKGPQQSQAMAMASVIIFLSKQVACFPMCFSMVFSPRVVHVSHLIHMLWRSLEIFRDL
jgi:hypothetical protein